MALPEPNAHTVRITRGGAVIFKAWLPESFGFSLQNQWQPSLAENIEGVINSVPGAKSGFDALNYTTGLTHRAQAATVLLWQGNSSVEFSLPMKMNAMKSASKEILVPLKALISAAMPSKAAGVFKAPSSAYGRSETFANAEERLDLWIGNYLYIPDVCIADIQWQSPARLGNEAQPISMDITLSILTMYTPTGEDVNAWFL